MADVKPNSSAIIIVFKVQETMSFHVGSSEWTRGPRGSLDINSLKILSSDKFEFVDLIEARAEESVE